MRTVLLLATIVMLLPIPGAAVTLDLDFDQDSAASAILNGQVIDDEYGLDGVTISAVNPNRAWDLAIAFDSTLSGTQDPDLEDPWSGGNLASNTLLGNLLILAENDAGGPPDDEGARPAGQLIFDFGFTATSLGFDIVDVESSTAEPGSVQFFRSDGGGGFDLQGSFTFMDLVTNGSAVFDSTISFGDNSANRVSPVLLAELDDAVGSEFDRVIFNLGGSGGLDNLVIATAPEPATWLLGALGLAWLGRRRARA